MISFDIETRQFTKSSDWGSLAYRSASTLAKAGAKSASSRLLERKPDNTKRTFWGHFTGANKARRRSQEMEHELKLARIKSGTDNRGIIKGMIDSRNERVNKRLDNELKNSESVRKDALALKREKMALKERKEIRDHQRKV